MNNSMRIFMGNGRTKCLLTHLANDGRVKAKHSLPAPTLASCHKKSRPKSGNIKADISKRSIGKGQRGPDFSGDKGLDAAQLPEEHRKRQQILAVASLVLPVRKDF